MNFFNFNKVKNEIDNSDITLNSSSFKGFANLFKSKRSKIQTTNATINADNDMIVEPKEDYDNNDELSSEPKYSSCIDTRALFLNYNGFEVINKDNPEDDIDDCKLIYDVLTEKLDIDGNADMIQINTDNYGDFYAYINWYEVMSGKKVIGKNIDFITYIEARYMRPIINNKGNIINYAFSAIGDFSKRGDGYEDGYVILELNEVIHFKNIQRKPSALAESLINPLRETLKNKIDLNKKMPVIIKHYAKPFVNYSIICEHGRIKNNPKIISLIRQQVEKTLQDMEADSDTVFPDYVKPEPINTPVQYPEKMIQDLNNDIYGKTKVPQSFFESFGSTDLKTSSQEKNFLRIIDRLQKNFEDIINNQFIKIFKEFSPDIKNKNANIGIVFKKVNINDLALRSNVANSAYGGGFITGNEARHFIGLSYKEGLDTLNKNKDYFNTPENKDPNVFDDVNNMKIKNDIPDNQKKTQAEKNNKRGR